MAQAGAEAPEETTKDPASLMRNLDGLRVISPGHLTPKYLLNPRLPRPDYTLAHPLGPPVSAATKHDPFARLEISPLDSPMNPFLRSEFVTSMGKIKGRGKTGLQRGNQRKMGKAVRRARAMGVIPAVGQSVPGGRVDY
ncbi:hypothetical protein MNV49_000072 [Pseudohyphozyma bogoriensis]|nr:hypothetical protein MNV49_000072 [Pseudohyphozyma bogoriensis]